MPPLILASTSEYRKTLLARLHLPFEVRSPQVDETAASGRDALLPWRSAWPSPRRAPSPPAMPGTPAGALVIGSDQVAHCEGTVMDKPGTHERAAAQLRAMRGKTTVFDTAVCA